MTNQEIADKISDMMGQGKTGLKKGYTDEYANDLLVKAKLNVLLDENKQLRAGLQDFSKTRDMVKLDELISTTPTTPRERNQQLRDLRIVLTDESSTVAGAEKIHHNLEEYFGEQMSKDRTVNLLKVMGAAEQKGVRFSGKVEYQSLKEMITERIPEGKISPEDVERMADALVAEHKQRLGIPLTDNDKENIKDFIKKAETPRVKVRASGDGSGYTTTAQIKSSKVRVRGSSGKISEARVRKHGKHTIKSN